MTILLGLRQSPFSSPTRWRATDVCGRKSPDEVHNGPQAGNDNRNQDHEADRAQGAYNVIPACQAQPKVNHVLDVVFRVAVVWGG